MHKNSYAVAPSMIDPEICDEIIRIGEIFDNTRAEVLDQRHVDELTRISIVSWFTSEQDEKHNIDLDFTYSYLMEKFSDVVATAGWSDWNIIRSQSFQYTKYEKSGHYDWHPDSFPNPFGPEQGQDEGLIRKLSMTLTLSDPDEYTGGEFMIEDLNASSPAEYWYRIKNLSVLEQLPKGSLIVFPSHCWHQVKPVTSGTRRSLVGWFVGPPWV